MSDCNILFLQMRLALTPFCCKQILVCLCVCLLMCVGVCVFSQLCVGTCSYRVSYVLAQFRNVLAVTKLCGVVLLIGSLCACVCVCMCVYVCVRAIVQPAPYIAGAISTRRVFGALQL